MNCILIQYLWALIIVKFVGESIEVKGTVGGVLDIGFRVAKIKTQGGDIMYFPNSELTIVKNLSRNKEINN